MANGLMSGLREFGENFVLSAGTQIAKNIQEQSKQDKADILTQTKLLRSTIAKNKAADAKIVSKMTNQANTLINLAPGITDDLLQQGISSDDSFNQLKKALIADEGKNAYFLSSWAKEKGIDNPASIYTPRKDKDRKSTSRLVSSLRTPAVIPEKPKSVSSDTESLFKLFLTGTSGPSGVIDEAERAIGRSGRGSMSSSDMQYAYGTPSRRVAPLDKPVSFDRVQEQKKIDIMTTQKMLPEYYKLALDSGLYTGVSPEQINSSSNAAEKRKMLAFDTGIDRKIQAVFATLPRGNQKLTDAVIKQQFTPPKGASSEDKEAYKKFALQLRYRVFQDYAENMETFSAYISDMNKRIVTGRSDSIISNRD